MSEPVKVNVVSYGGVKPGQLIVGNAADGSKITLFDAATATNGSYMFYKCAGLTSFTVGLPNLTDATSMFEHAGLTSWTTELPKLTDGKRMFLGCYSLTSWTGELPKLTNAPDMFDNTGLTSWTVELPELTNGSTMFYKCAGLTSFTVGLPNLTDGTQMFQNCNLDASSVLQILTSIPDRASAGLAAAKLHIGRNTNYKDDADVAALLGTVTPIAAGTYSCKGWTIDVQA